MHVSSPHTLPVLRQARARGAELVLIDPVHHRTAGLCQRFIQPRPAGDFALAMAVARLLFDRGQIDPDAGRFCDHLEDVRALAGSQAVAEWCRRADVPIGDAEDLADRLGPGKPTAILVGWGMGRRTVGGAIVRALDALSAISGNLGIPGRRGVVLLLAAGGLRPGVHPRAGRRPAIDLRAAVRPRGAGGARPGDPRAVGDRRQPGGDVARSRRRWPRRSARAS